MHFPSLTLNSFPRIHLTLIDLGYASLRVNGGIGFALDGLPSTVVASRADNDKLIIPAHFDAQGRRDLEEALVRLREYEEYPPTELTVTCSVPQHVGFGTKTSTILGVLQAVSLLYEIQIGDAELVRLSRRGTTSGIGIATFFCGGLIADAGRKRVGRDEFQPSGSAQLRSPSTSIVRLSMPAQWQCHLILPQGTLRCGVDESTFFRLHTPIGKREVLKVFAAVYHGICPAVAEADFQLFRQALIEVHRLGFKHREVCGQPRVVTEVLRRINANVRLAAGMSSMGPLIHVMEEGEGESVCYLSAICAEAGARYLGTFPLRNTGFEIG